MDIVSEGPVRAASILWQPAHGGWVLTVVCKATYTLAPGESALAEEQEYINEDDNHWNDDPARSLYSPNDLAPFKVRADVMLVGHAFTPRGEPARAITARLGVGDLDKAIEVFADRAWTQDRKLREGARFSKMPLRYERAAGGPETSNPVGVREGARDMYGSVTLPNLQPVGRSLSSPDDAVEPINFGPVSPAWRDRRERLGRHAETWSDTEWNTRPLPDDIDPTFFNAAPRDQQIPELSERERIVLEHLHPTHARLVTNLPGSRPYVFVARPGATPQEVTLKADTLWIDTDRSICTLTWRGQVKLDNPRQEGRVIVAMGRPGQRLLWADVKHIEAEEAAPPEEPQELTMDALPDPDEEPDDTAMLTSNPLKAALPFVPAPAAKLPAVVLPPIAPPPIAAPSITSAPIAQPIVDSPWASHTPKSHELSAILPPPRPPAPAAAPPLPAPSLPSTGLSSLSPSLPSPSLPSPSLPSPSAPSLSSPSLPSPSLPSPSVPTPPAAARPTSPSSSAITAVATLSTITAAAASNAAAASTAWASANPAPIAPEPTKATASTPRPAARPTREVIDLLWYDPAFVDRIREEPKWKELLSALKPKSNPFDDDPFEDAPKMKAPEKEKLKEERRDVIGILTRASTTDLDGVNEAIAEAVAEDGTFDRPLLVLAGDLTFPFDELETLKATVTAVTPLVAGDKKLKETVDTVNELLKTPWLQGSSGVAEGLTQRVRDAFAQGNRMLPASYLDTHTERVLLEQRHYQKRTVFGEPWIRSLLAPVGSTQSIPAYLPEGVSKKLPMFQTIRARVIAEAHLQQDQYETYPSALRVIALSRVASLPAGRAGSR